MHYTKCMKCRRWDFHDFCGVCHHCGDPGIVDACVAYRATKSVESDIRGHHARKRESTPTIPNLGQNGTKPRASDPRRNWWEPVWNAEKGTKVRDRDERYVWRVSPNGDIVRVVDTSHLYGEYRTRALYGIN